VSGVQAAILTKRGAESRLDINVKTRNHHLGSPRLGPGGAAHVSDGVSVPPLRGEDFEPLNHVVVLERSRQIGQGDLESLTKMALLRLKKGNLVPLEPGAPL